MTKKEILVTLGIFVFVLAGAGAGLFVFTKKQATQANTASTTGTSESQQQAQSMPLTETPTSQQNSGDSLTVVAGTNTSNPAQLGSGQTASKPADSSNGCTTKTAPGPESFQQYEQYKSGQSALTGDIVVCSGTDALQNGYKAAVYYKGWLTNGTLFDQSKPGSDGNLQPFILTLGAHQVIRGWEEGLIGMKKGDTRRIIVPPAAGYGASQQGSIPANSILIFDVQLLDLKAP